MTRRALLPSSLGESFTTLEAARAGVTPSRLRAADLHPLAHGARSRTTPPSLPDRARALAESILPDEALFVGPTAALLHGMWLPPRWEDAAGVGPLHVASSRPQDRVRRPEVVWHKGGHLRAVREVAGVRVSSAVDTWADLAVHLDLPDLVAAGDSLHPWRPDQRPWGERRVELQPRPWLPPVLGSVLWPRRPGRTRAAEAASLVRAGSASRPESVLRVHLVRGGLPEPRTNADVWSRRDRWLAVADLWWEEARLVGEYDGDQHRADPRQWQRDRERLQALRDDGCTVVTVASRELFCEPESVVRRFLAAYHRAV